MKKIMVIGAGQMGSGIAQVCAQSDLGVLIYDIDEKFTKGAFKKIDAFLSKGVVKGKLTEEEKNKALSKIMTTLNLSDASDVDFVIEAAPENIDLKKKIFSKLDEICPQETILSTNTSSLSITDIASATKRPEKVIGMHFFNPVPLMKLIEIIYGLETSKETFNKTEELAIKLGKTPVKVKDFPGFVSNRLLMPMINEAVYVFMEGISSAEDIDTVMKLGMNHPMGPLELADLIGLDTCLHVMETLYEGFKDSKYRPCPLLKNMVSSGRLGRKTGKGFYEY
ncbi:MAG: 3-hydroxybutyryl-CoA dehydrogenase [Candidatus Humimicrobiia bacterium]